MTVAELGVPRLAGWSLSWLVYAGSAQLAAVGLLAGSASAAVVVASVAVINLRLALYSAALAPHWRGTSKAWRLVAAYLLVDPSFAVGTQSYDGSRPPRQAHLHYLGGALVLWAGWLTVIAIGVTAGAAMPAELRLESDRAALHHRPRRPVGPDGSRPGRCRRRGGHRGARVDASTPPGPSGRHGDRPARGRVMLGRSS